MQPPKCRKIFMATMLRTILNSTEFYQKPACCRACARQTAFEHQVPLLVGVTVFEFRGLNSGPNRSPNSIVTSTATLTTGGLAQEGFPIDDMSTGTSTRSVILDICSRGTSVGEATPIVQVECGRLLQQMQEDLVKMVPTCKGESGGGRPGC